MAETSLAGQRPTTPEDIWALFRESDARREKDHQKWKEQQAEANRQRAEEEKKWREQVEEPAQPALAGPAEALHGVEALAAGGDRAQPDGKYVRQLVPQRPPLWTLGGILTQKSKCCCPAPVKRLPRYAKLGAAGRDGIALSHLFEDGIAEFPPVLGGSAAGHRLPGPLVAGGPAAGGACGCRAGFSHFGSF